MALFRRPLSELREAHRASEMAAVAAEFKTRDLRGRLEWSCDQREPDKGFLSELLDRSPKINDESLHARILRDHATAAEITPELIRTINVHETFGIAGTRMLTEVQGNSTTKLFGPITDEDGNVVLVMVDHVTSRATMVKKRGVEVRTDAAAVIELLFADWERGGPRSAGIQAFVKEMGHSAIAAMEKGFDEGFNKAVAVSDGFDVRSLAADTVLVIDGTGTILFEDPSGFTRDKILISSAELNDNVVVSPKLDDLMYGTISNQVRDRAIGQCHARVLDASTHSIDSIMMAAKSGAAGKMVFITERRFCPDTLPENGRHLEMPKKRIGI